MPKSPLTNTEVLSAMRDLGPGTWRAADVARRVIEQKATSKQKSKYRDNLFDPKLIEGLFTFEEGKESLVSRVKKRVRHQLDAHTKGTAKNRRSGNRTTIYYRKAGKGRYQLIHRDESRVDTASSDSTADALSYDRDVSDATGGRRRYGSFRRLIRSTKVISKVKKRQKDRCQICNKPFAFPDGHRYSEGHHVKPYGKPHCGDDKVDNVICVCPSCHVLLDYGAIALKQESCPAVDPKNVRYHNEVIFRT